MRIAPLLRVRSWISRPYVPLAALGSPGKVQWTAIRTVYLYIAALDVYALNCRESRFDTRSQRLPLAVSRRPARVTSYTC